ncbi:MAG TPA: helix-turn-helix domain-containing protein [Blastocatellia bacterium]|nr:helix-turn-helix domain-containing protein [Blastocatellia bacterium]
MKNENFNRVPHTVERNNHQNPTSSELLEQYLALSAEDRSQKFPDTAGAANIIGLSRRTIQLWIETGAIQAVLIGGKYRVYLDSVRAYLEKRESERWR